MKKFKDKFYFAFIFSISHTAVSADLCFWMIYYLFWLKEILQHFAKNKFLHFCVGLRKSLFLLPFKSIVTAYEILHWQFSLDCWFPPADVVFLQHLPGNRSGSSSPWRLSTLFHWDDRVAGFRFSFHGVCVFPPVHGTMKKTFFQNSPPSSSCESGVGRAGESPQAPAGPCVCEPRSCPLFSSATCSP